MYYDFHYKAKITSFGKWMVVRLNEIIVKKIIALFGPTGTVKICEIGHGRGLFADVLRSGIAARMHYYGIEPNEALYRAGIEKGYTLKNGVIPPFPEDPDWRAFDCIYISHVLEHLQDHSTVNDVLSAFYKKLKPDGYLVIVYPDYLDYKEDYFDVDYSHEYIITDRRIRQLTADAGFTILEMSSFRSCFSGLSSLAVYPVHRTIKFIAGILLKFIGTPDILFKMKMTFGRNVLVICRKNTTT